jgi:hypothetical protein
MKPWFEREQSITEFKEPVAYKGLNISVSKTKVKPPYIAIVTSPATSKEVLRTGGETEQAALDSAKQAVDKREADAPKISASGQTSILLNTPSNDELLKDPTMYNNIYAKISKDGRGPTLVIGNEVYGAADLEADGFVRSYDRRMKKNRDSEEALPQIMFNASNKTLSQLGIKMNGRYTLDTEGKYRDDNEHMVYPLQFQGSTIHAGDKLRMSRPALTIGATREDVEPWFQREFQEAEIIKFPQPVKNVAELPNVQSYPDFLTGVKDLHNRRERGEISQNSHDRLYQDLIHRFMRKESFETPWFIKEGSTPDANIDDLQQIQQALSDIVGGADIIKIHNVKETLKLQRPLHLRAVQKAKPLDKDELLDILKKLPQGSGIRLNPITDPQKQISNFGAGEPLQFQYKGKNYYILAKKTVASGTGEKIKLFNKKELTPGVLGLATSYNDKKTLANDIAQKVKQKYNDDRGAILLHIMNNALNYGNQQSVPENLKYILQNNTMMKQISQDFGESIGPLLYSETGKIDFPVGNEPVIDIKIGNVGIAIKSLSGSGNSMVKLKEIIDAYAETIDQKDLKKITKIRTFQKLADKSVNVIDGIIQIAKDVDSPEMTALETATRKMKIYNLSQLIKAVEKLIYDRGKLLPYDKSMAKIEKILSASGKTFGMPRDRGTPKALRKYKQDPKIYTAYVLTYGLGKGLENVIVNGVDKDAYGNLLKDIMKTVKAKAGFVSIDTNGIVKFQVKDFKDLNFKFDYHAFTTKPGNNRPGFVVFP